jgi:hypothetical protein
MALTYGELEIPRRLELSSEPLRVALASADGSRHLRGPTTRVRAREDTDLPHTGALLTYRLYDRDEAPRVSQRLGLIARDDRCQRESQLSHPGKNYSMRMPEMDRAITSCWISLVPSKMVWILASRCQRSTGYSRV